jgi:hypothetical protein
VLPLGHHELEADGVRCCGPGSRAGSQHGPNGLVAPPSGPEEVLVTALTQVHERNMGLLTTYIGDLRSGAVAAAAAPGTHQPDGHHRGGRSQDRGPCQAPGTR